jgi:single-strand DNA-binding protein
MRSINKVTLIGNIGNDPEIKILNDQKKVAHFSLATTEYHKDKLGNQKSETEWHTITAWGAVADVVENLCRKGSYIFVEGKLKTRNYEDAQGNKKYVTEIVINEIIILDKKLSQTT